MTATLRGTHVRVGPDKSVLVVPQRYLPGGDLAEPWYTGKLPLRVAWMVCCTACLWAIEVDDRAAAVSEMQRHAADPACVTAKPVAPKRRPPKPGVAYPRWPWLPEEDAYLLAYPDTPAAVLGAALGRSKASVLRRLHRLHGHTPAPRRVERPWLPEEDALLRDPQGLTAGQIAARLGRTGRSVRSRAARLGVTVTQPGVAWPPEETAALLRCRTLQEARVALPHRSDQSLMARARRAGRPLTRAGAGVRGA